jgi:hypothetical protein
MEHAFWKLLLYPTSIEKNILTIATIFFDYYSQSFFSNL